jgi:protein phosphatase
LDWTGITHCGKVRRNNEDTFLGLTFDATSVQYLGKFGRATLSEHDFVFAVSDGMGGARAGEFASRITIDKITRLMPKAFLSGAKGIEAGFDDIFQELFVGIHSALSLLGSTYPECHGMGATLSLCWFTPEWMFFAHIGDSRIYYLPASGELKQVTNDDTHVGWLFRNGRINEREARSHPRRNALQKALGADHQFVDPQVGAINLQIGDRFLLCTDGVTDGLWDRQLLQLLREPTEQEAALPPAQRIVESAVEKSGRDNATAIVIEVLPPQTA